jgi:hypothetical protein
LSPHAGTGWVQLSLPRGDQRMELTLGATPNQRAGELVSAAGVVAVVVIGIVADARIRARARARARARIPARAQIPARAGIQLLGALAVLPSLALAAQLIRALDPPRPPAMQTMDFAGRPFAHRGPITFTGVDGQAYTLTAATVLPARVSAGDPFTVTTAWQDGRAPAEFGVEQELPSGGYFALLFRFARSVSLGDPAVGAHVALPEALPGPLLLKLRARDAQGGWLTPTVASNAFQGGALLDGLRVTAQSQPAPGQALRVFPNGIVLHAVDWIHTTENDLCIRPAWSTNRPQADALKVAWRLRGSDGRDIAGADGEPQAGLAPVWSWPVGATVRDNYCTSLASPLKPGEAYTLQARWYRVSDGRVSGEVILVGERGDALFDLHAPRVAVTRHSRQPPPAQRSSQLAFGGLIRLAGYDVLTSTQALTLTLHWQALGPIPADYKLFVHLSPPQSAEPAAQADQQALGGLYPTGMWQAGEAVSDRVALDWAGLAPGRYRLAVGWYDPDTLQRLPATDAGEPVADGWAVLAEVER